MKTNEALRGRKGSLFCAIGAAILAAGCSTTYVEHQTVVHEESPPPPPPAPAVVEVAVIHTESDFYEPLTPYGHWEIVGPYGRCWVPARVDPDWRPYCNGHWERTEAGWYWASDEPWGWATYHYGRWDFSPRIGWYWVPQTQWAPAWVSWRRGGGYVGWAPLHPSSRFDRAGVLIEEQNAPTRDCVFVEERRFLEPVQPRTVVVNNTTIINKTVTITNVKVVNNTVINEGPRTEIIEKASGRPVRQVAVRELRRKSEGEVVAKQKASGPVREDHVAASPASVPTQNADSDAQGRRELEAQKQKEQQIEAQKAAREKQAQAEAERREQESQRKAKLEADARAKELERQRQAEAQQQMEVQKAAREKQAQAEAQRREQEAQRNAQMEQVRAKASEKKTETDAQRHERQQQAQVERQQETKGKAQGPGEERAQAKQPVKEKAEKKASKAGKRADETPQDQSHQPSQSNKTP